MKLSGGSSTPKTFDVSCAADWDKIPFGFCRVQANGRESLAYRDSAFGVLRDVRPAFKIGALEIRLERPIAGLPIVQVHVRVAEPGVARLNGRLVVDTETRVRNDVVEYEPSVV